MTPFETQVAQALGEIFRTMGLRCAGRQGDELRWSGDDLATDLAPRVAAAIEAGAPEALGWIGQLTDDWRAKKIAAALAALRGQP